MFLFIQSIKYVLPMKNLKISILFIAFVIYATTIRSQSSIYIDYSNRGAEISKSMYGIFFEELNHAGDGALYGELIQNRGFEEQVIPSGTTLVGSKVVAPSKPNYVTGKIVNFSKDWKSDLEYTAWSLSKNKCIATMSIAEEYPLHKNTPHSMKIEISNMEDNGFASFKNSGYWGVPVKKGETYKLRFYLRTSDYIGKVKAKIISGSGVFILAEKEFEIVNNGEWEEYKTELITTGTTYDGVFQLEFNANGTVWVDYVSLFPKETFKGRENGLRKDVAQMLADLKPAFVRWPGGCIVEGLTLENRVKWKETIGDPMTRRGEWSLWGYRTTMGFGYHEFLQFCEDIGADAMFVGNVGLSCTWSNGDYASKSELPGFLQDIHDAIEYAISDISTEWGAKRAENGHPEPFPLKYVELGNEQVGSMYAGIYNQFYASLKATYPHITFINTLGLEETVNEVDSLDMIDPHFYEPVTWFYDNCNLWDLVYRKDYKIYVGEYACNKGVGAGNMDAALSEAAFISGMERNGDLVTMTSYAPLIENNNNRNWPTNMIWVNNEKVMGRSSYYVQKMFSNNRPDYNLSTKLILNGMIPVTQGRIGLGTWSTAAEYKDVKVTDLEGNKIYYEADFQQGQTDWIPFAGIWTFQKDGVYRQSDLGTRRISMMNKWMFNDCVIELKARKLSGSEGFLIICGAGKDNLNNHFQINLGGWNNSQSAIERVTNGAGTVVSQTSSFKVTTNKWYDIKVVLKEGNKIECFIDGESILKCSMNNTDRIQAISGYDEESGETVVKVVNGTAKTQNINIVLNCRNITTIGKAITLSSSSLSNENSMANPTAIIPVETIFASFSSNFAYNFKPYSFTILRIKTDKEAGSELEIPSWYSKNPIPLFTSGVDNVNVDSHFDFYLSGANVWTVKSFSASIKNITVLDMNGKIILSKKSIANSTAYIDLNNVDSGVYLTEILTSKDQKYVKKLQVKR